MSNFSLDKALDEWRSLLGSEAVATDPKELERYAALCISPVSHHIPAVLRPKTSTEVQDVVRIARRHKIPLYPISTGNNWGYGSSNPPRNGCVIVDLSQMKGFELNTELGVVSLEPGVTQGELWTYLSHLNLPFLVPVTGAGPNCSLLGNALERGFGITPHADHFGAVISLEAVLADGTIYRSALAELGGHQVDSTYKWGLGPYLDGLFSQGAFGIVTRMTIALAPTPEKVLAFIFEIEEDEQLEDIVVEVRGLLNSLGGVVGSFNLMNRERMLSMMTSFPSSETKVGEAVPEIVYAKLAKQHKVAAWTGMSALYGNKEVVNAARSVIKRSLRGKVKNLHFVDQRMARFAQNLLARIPGNSVKKLKARTDRLSSAINILSGQPSEIALPLAYWRSGSTPAAAMRDPARDGCGLIWYAPLVPMLPRNIRTFVEMVKSICPKYGIDPLITLTSLSGRCFDGTVPILYDKRHPGAAERAQECFRALFAAGQREGFLPYRLGIHAMALAMDTDKRFWSLVAELRSAVDPDNIIAPGRYSPR